MLYTVVARSHPASEENSQHTSRKQQRPFMCQHQEHLRYSIHTGNINGDGGPSWKTLIWTMCKGHHRTAPSAALWCLMNHCFSGNHLTFHTRNTVSFLFTSQTFYIPYIFSTHCQVFLSDRFITYFTKYRNVFTPFFLVVKSPPTVL